MLTTVKGIYENGKVSLLEKPTSEIKSEVSVTFIREIEDSLSKKRKLGGLEGKIIMSKDFDEPIDDLKEFMF